MFRRRNRRRRDAPRIELPTIPWWSLLSVLGAVLVVGGLGLLGLWAMDRPIEKVVVNAAFQRVTADQLEAILRPHVGEGFVSIDLHDIQEQLAGVPWVARARVSRRWPGTLEVTITEEIPAARWGRAGLLNARGRLFVSEATHIPRGLPRLEGPEGSEQRVARRFVKIQEQLVQRGLTANGLRLDERGAWTFRLSNGIEVRLGSEAVDERQAMFFRALDRVVAARAEEVDYVDMRYANGFTVGWKVGDSAKAAADSGDGPNV